MTPPNAAAHAVRKNARIDDGSSLRTGPESRAEIVFPDRTVLRLGANAAFKIDNATGGLNLGEGALLVQTPKSARGAKIQAGEVAVELPGTTIVLEYHPTHYKLLVLDGTGRLFRPGHLGDSILVNAGQMVFGQPDKPLSDPIDFDLGRFLKTSRFITEFAPLGSEALIAKESDRQKREKSDKKLIDTNLVILGGGTLVSLVDPAQIDAIHRQSTAGKRKAASESSSKPKPKPH